MVGRLSFCTAERIANYIIFSFSYSQDWEPRLVSWFANLLYSALGDFSSPGLNCELFPRLECVLHSQTGVGTINLVPLQLMDDKKIIFSAIVRVMGVGGTDIHSILNHLQTRLKIFVMDAISCPKLLCVHI